MGPQRGCDHASTSPHSQTSKQKEHMRPSLNEIINRALDGKLVTVNGRIFKEQNSRALPPLHTNTVDAHQR